MKKLSENKILIIASTIISIIILIILMNIKNTMIANITILSTMLLGTIFAIIIAKIKKRNILKYISTSLSCFLICLVLFNIFAYLDMQIGWSSRIEYNKIEHSIKSTSDLIYKTDQTKLYYDNKNQILYSICEIENEFHILQGHVTNAQKTEYTDLYGNGFKAKNLSKNLKELYIHEPTTSTISTNEYILEMINNNDETFVGKALIVGTIDEINNYEKVLEISYGEYYYDIYKDIENKNFLIHNNLETTRTPYLNTPHKDEDYFSYRFEKYMQEFDKANTEEADGSNYIFKVQFTEEIKNNDKVKRITVYDQIENEIYTIGSFIEIVYNDGTSDIAFTNNLYGNKITSVKIY